MDAGHVLEEFFDLASFPDELFVVGEVLVLAATAFAEERALGETSVGGGFEDFDEVGLGVGFVVAEDACADGFAGQGVWDEDDPCRVFLIEFHPRNADSKVGEGGDFDIDFVVVVEGIRVEFFRSAHGSSVRFECKMLDSKYWAGWGSSGCE